VAPQKTLSIVMPAFNEAETIPLVLDKINTAPLQDGLEKEIIVVNDCSTDDTERAVLSFQADHPGCLLHYFKHDVNRGKGAALRTGIGNASGDFIVIQDADLEYDPREYRLLLQPMLDGFADVVYGSRFKGDKPHRILFFWHTIGNRFLTFVSNLFTNLNLSDVETCYKMFKGPLLKSIRLRENHFGFEPEITAKMSRIKGVRIYEVGISYYGRTYPEGKKIGWKDGVRALYCMLKYGLFRVDS
jgi:glycosyltransferase involved in cell wall biosynthesis